MTDPINPNHYKDVVPGIECIDVAKHFDFLKGGAIKYIWRAGRKGDEATDLRKAIRCLEERIKDLEKANE